MAADTTDVLAAAKGVGGVYLYGGVIILIILTGFGYGYSQFRSTGNSQCISRGDHGPLAWTFEGSWADVPWAHGSFKWWSLAYNMEVL